MEQDFLLLQTVTIDDFDSYAKAQATIIRVGGNDRGETFRILCGNCTFSQNFHTRKLGEIKVFFAVIKTIILKMSFKRSKEVTWEYNKERSSKSK